MLVPRSPVAQDRCAATGVDDGLLEILARPGRDRMGDRIALGRGAEHWQRRAAMVRGVGVEANPAIPRPVVAGRRVPHGWDAPTHRSE
jgi:hypothetical protein